MTYKEKKEFLESYLHAEYALQSSLEEYERWKTIGTKVNQIFKTIPGGVSVERSKVEQAAVEMASILESIEAEINAAKTAKAEILAAINKTPRKRHRELLTYRYVRRLSNAQIAEIIGKDLRTVRRVMNTAIYQFNP